MRWRLLTRDPLAGAGLIILALMAAAALAAPWLSPYDPAATAPRDMLQPPSAEHPLGTDDLGRDVLSRMLHAGRVSLGLAAGVAVLSVAIGALLGGTAGMLGGRTDRAISAVIDTMLAIPPLALAMVASAFVPLDAVTLTVILALVSWTGVARLARGQVLSLREREYVEAARAAGSGHARLLLRHLLPGATAPLVVAGTLLVATAILIESALSFLGFGLPPPTASWGGMLNEAQLWFAEAPWLAVFPGLAITLAVASVNVLGEGLRAVASGREAGER
ncbi:MAG: ABC transporter permease [Trueperaceae bacterium]|nr:ABC transporter permease [Trueperaceae bacterium]